MPLEDFTTYTETDPNSRITVAPTKASWAGLQHDEDAFVYADKSVAHFDGDFEFLLEVQADSMDAGGGSSFLCVANAIDDSLNLSDFILLELTESAGTFFFNLSEKDSGTQYYSQWTGLSLSTLYYPVFERDESVGTFGTIYCRIYSDSARTSLITTLSIALHSSKKDWRYIYACQSFNNGTTPAWTGFTQNLDLQESIVVFRRRIESYN